MTVLFGSVVAVDQHDVPPGHPERHARLDAVRDGAKAARLDDCLIDIPSRRARMTELARVHDERYLEAIARLCEAGGGELDADTSASPGSWSTALESVGLGLAAIDALRAGQADAAFVAPRPPGHHATRDRAMGFCLLNNVAVAAAALEADGEKVAIVDWDVHHGNGTQEIFWDDPSVLYASMHEWPAYPGTGRAIETGGPGAPGLTVNVPLPAGATGDVALAAVDDVIGPAIDDFAPTWILVSAGYDAHRDDPLADLSWSAGDFALLTSRVQAWAPGPGRVVAFLEGGYDLAALRLSVQATVATLAGTTCLPEPPTSGGPGLEAVAQAGLARRARGGA
jgi:acetoin utilization deacetylase AcuC-like enzyme